MGDGECLDMYRLRDVRPGLSAVRALLRRGIEGGRHTAGGRHGHRTASGAAARSAPAGEC